MLWLRGVEFEADTDHWLFALKKIKSDLIDNGPVDLAEHVIVEWWIQLQNLMKHETCL